MSAVQFIDYFGSNIICNRIPNDIIGSILLFLDPSAIIIIQKINQLLLQLSNEEIHYLIETDTHPNYIYNPLINYRNSKIDYHVLKEICWIVTNMPVLYEVDNRKSFKNGLGKDQKHRIEHIHDYGFSCMKPINLFKLPSKKSLFISRYLKTNKSLHYISRSATILSFLIYGFQRINYVFKCKQVRLTKKIILQNIHLFKECPNINGYPTTT